MRLPNLGALDRLAGRADAYLGKQIGSSIRSMASREAARGAGPLTAHVARNNPSLAFAMKGASRAGAIGSRVGLAAMGLGISVAATAAVGAVGLAYGAGRVYNAALNSPTVRPNLKGLPSIERGGGPLTWAKHGRIPFTNRHVYAPMASPRLADMLGAGGVTAGILGGVQDANRGRNMTVTQALDTGAMEIERENMMGATGSLTISMYNQRHKRGSLLDRHRASVEQAQRQSAPISSAAMSMDRTEMVHALHMAHMAVGG